MTTADAKPTRSSSRFRLPDPPQREPDEMTQYDHLFKTGNSRYLAIHLGNPDTTLVEADRWIIANPGDDRTRARRPDLLVAFGADPADYEASNGYVVSEQGKPPDFVLEVASESTVETDVGAKRDEYAVLGILEYWRFDKTGEFHGIRLAGDRLVDGAYQPIPIDELDDGSLEGHSAALNLNLRWEQGQLGLYPDAEIVTDVAGGLNWKRRGLVSILERLHRGDKLDVVVAHRDRLARFGFELIEWLVQQNGGRVVVLNQQDASPESELTEDLLAILHTFPPEADRMHGLRRYRTAIAADTGLSELAPEGSDCDLDGRQPVELQPDG